MMKTRNEFGSYLLSLGLKRKGVEVGTYRAEYASILLSSWPGTLYMIDPWMSLGEEYIDASNQKNFEIAREAFSTIDPFKERAIAIKTFSKQASELFPDSSLDFVYIDGNHEYSYVKQDIETWFPKVKTGGIVAGHDFLPQIEYSEGVKNVSLYQPNGEISGVYGVNPAVEEFCNKEGYTFNLTDEWWSTWYFIK